MSKLLQRAKVKLENANHDYCNMSKSDAYIDDCCFNLQQAIELSLKYIVEINGLNYIENHDIRAQLNLLNNIEVKLPFEKELRMHASTINSWQTESRYNDKFIALIEDINEIKELAELIITYADNLVTIK